MTCEGPSLRFEPFRRQYTLCDCEKLSAAACPLAHRLAKYCRSRLPWPTRSHEIIAASKTILQGASRCCRSCKACAWPLTISRSVSTLACACCSFAEATRFANLTHAEVASKLSQHIGVRLGPLQSFYGTKSQPTTRCSHVLFHHFSLEWNLADSHITTQLRKHHCSGRVASHPPWSGPRPPAQQSRAQVQAHAQEDRSCCRYLPKQARKIPTPSKAIGGTVFSMTVNISASACLRMNLEICLIMNPIYN